MQTRHERRKFEKDCARQKAYECKRNLKRQSTSSTSGKPSGYNAIVRRSTPKPYHKVAHLQPSHREKRETRRAARAAA